MISAGGASFNVLASSSGISTDFRCPETQPNKSGNVPSPLLLSKTAILRKDTVSFWHGFARFDPILFAKLVKSRTHRLTTVFADSWRASGSHTFLRNRTRSGNTDLNGPRRARSNERITAHDVDQFVWSRDVMRRLPTQPGDRLRDFLPDTWFATHPEARRKRAA